AVTPGGGRAIMSAVEQLTFGNEPAAVRAAVSPSGPGYEIERELAAAGASCVAGVDEVGRGAWAGPVTVCAVIVRAGFPDPPAWVTRSSRSRRTPDIPRPRTRKPWPPSVPPRITGCPGRTWMTCRGGGTSSGPGPMSRASCPCYDLGCRDEASDANTTVELR